LTPGWLALLMCHSGTLAAGRKRGEDGLSWECADAERLPQVLTDGLHTAFAVPQVALRLWGVRGPYQSLACATPVTVDVAPAAVILPPERARKTTTTVERDKSGLIIKTTATEKDA
jgi:hypothetical protein